jgi:hypothetical protein
MASKTFTSSNQFTRFAPPTEFKKSEFSSKAKTNSKHAKLSRLLAIDAAAAKSGPSSLRTTNRTKKQTMSKKRHQPYIRPQVRSSITPPSSPVRISEKHTRAHNFMDLSLSALNNSEDQELSGAYTHYKASPNAGSSSPGMNSNGGNHYSRLDSENYEHYAVMEDAFNPLNISAYESMEYQDFHQLLFPRELSSEEPTHLAHPSSFEGNYDLHQYSYVQQDCQSRNSTTPFQAPMHLSSSIPLAQRQPHIYASDNHDPQDTLQTETMSPQDGDILSIMSWCRCVC